MFDHSSQQILFLVGKKIIELAVPLGIIFIIFSGIRIMAAGSDPERLAKGKRFFLSTIIGLLLLFFIVSLMVGKDFVPLMDGTLGSGK